MPPFAIDRARVERRYPSGAPEIFFLLQEPLTAAPAIDQEALAPGWVFPLSRMRFDQSFALSTSARSAIATTAGTG